MAAGWQWPTAQDIQRAKQERRRFDFPLWAQRFEAYRLLGPGRALLAVYNAERAMAGKSRAHSVPAAWDTVAQWGGWKQRAEAWDASELDRQRAEREAEERKLRERAREQRRRLLDAGYVMILEAMARSKQAADDRTVSRLLGAIARYNAETRTEFDDLPAQRLEHSGPGGGAIQSQSSQVLLYLPDNARGVTEESDGDGNGVYDEN